MDLNDLKKYESPELNVIPKYYCGEELEQLRWNRGLNKEMPHFRVDFSDSLLKQNKIIVPIFVDDMLLPFTYISPSKKESKSEPKTCSPYSNHVFFEIPYRRGHLLKLVHHFGIRTFNDNDQKYLKSVVIEKVEYHFEYDFQLERWKWAQHEKNIKKWVTEKEKIDLLFETDEVIEITRKFFSSREEFSSKQLKDFKTYEDLFNVFENLLESTIQFIKLRRTFGDISKFPFEKMTHLLTESNAILKCLQKDVETEALTDYRPTKTDAIEYQINNRISNLYISFKSKIFEPGYWVIGLNVYPNIGEYYNLSQKSSDNRTSETKYVLKQELIKQADGQNIFIPLSLIEMKKRGD